MSHTACPQNAQLINDVHSHSTALEGKNGEGEGEEGRERKGGRKRRRREVRGVQGNRGQESTPVSFLQYLPSRFSEGTRLARKAESPACLCLLSGGIISLCHCAPTSLVKKKSTRSRDGPQIFILVSTLPSKLYPQPNTCIS